MKIFIDSSVFIRHFYGVDKAIKILDYTINRESAFTSPNVLEETYYKLIYIETERLFGKTGKFAVKEKFRKEIDKYGKVFAYIEDFILNMIKNNILTCLK